MDDEIRSLIKIIKNTILFMVAWSLMLSLLGAIALIGIACWNA